MRQDRREETTEDTNCRMNTTLSARQAQRDIMQALTLYERHNTRGLPAILEKQGKALCIGSKGVKGLYQEAREHMPETIAQINALKASESYAVRRKAGVSRDEEIARRLKQAGRYQSTGWLDPSFVRTPRGAQLITERGKVVFRGSGRNRVLILTNDSEGAKEFADKTGYMVRAVNNRSRDMRAYVQKKMNKDARAFSRPVRQVHFDNRLEEVPLAA